MAFNAIKRKGFGAACTAVLVKFLFPLMSYWLSDKITEKSGKSLPTSRACTWTSTLARFRFFAITTFAIPFGSNGLSGWASFDVRLSGNFVISELGKNYPKG